MLKVLTQMNVLFVRAVIFFNDSLKLTKIKPGFIFCAILIFIDLTKKLVGVILRKEEMPDSVGRLHSVVNKAATVLRKGGFTF